MKFLHDYIIQFTNSDDNQKELAERLSDVKQAYDIHLGGDPISAFESFVESYCWLGLKETKACFGITQNLARNLPGALMQDYLLSLAIKLIQPYPKLDTFTEVRVPFGRYPLWANGNVKIEVPCERSDIAVGYLTENDEIISESKWPKQPFYTLASKFSIIPLITINSKIRVSQSEFFDWFGREQLMTKGNPHCLSIQVALRKEMVLSIVEASQAGDKFFLLGDGGETSVTPDRHALEELIENITDHLHKRMEDSFGNI